MSEKPMVTARDLIAALRKLPPDMPVEFRPIGPITSEMRAFQLNVWSAKGNATRRPYPKSAKAEIYIGVLP